MPESRPDQAKPAAPRSSQLPLPARGAARGSGDFPVVGLGASAGGLDAFRRLFDALPADNGMAFVLIQHLDPTHISMMVELLANHTQMKVQQAADGMPLEPENVYVIPPGAYLAIKDGALRLSQPRERHGARLPVDFFLRSLAEERGENAICVILSGTGGDGSLGLMAVKEKGGLVIVQSPDEAGFDGMPRSAIRTGAADHVLPVAEIAEVLAKYDRETSPGGSGRGVAGGGDTPTWLTTVIDLLRTKTTHDFALYKPGTLLRRLDRRMAMAAIVDRKRYLDLLSKDPGELGLLANDLLINVTGFFRDPEAFDLLAAQIVPDLVHRQAAGRPLRIWVAACSSGEETYSIAMLFLEAIAAAKQTVALQIFASDIDADAIAVARNGLYPESIASDVSPARLARFFAKEEHGYRVGPELRSVVVFAVQDLLADPPFSRLDLVSCRNLLIYLRPEAQQKVLLLFHFALREGGVLFLGGSETVGGLDDRFEPISSAQHIYRPVGRTRPGEVELPIAAGDYPPVPPAPGVRLSGPRAVAGPRELTQRVLLETYAPASVLINAKSECLYFFGPTDRYLRVAAGEPSRDLLALVREGLRNKLRTAIRRASLERVRTFVSGGRVSNGASAVSAGIDIQPVDGPGDPLLLVSFIDEPEPEHSPRGATGPSGSISRVGELEGELDATRKELQSAIRDLEISNEEQKAINEEAMSVNEEFQSTNEELVTSKEELQSLNEELTALNSQIQETLEHQRSTSNDLQNILESTGVATLFLDRDLNIRFSTPAAKSLFRILASDVGRPLADLTLLAGDGGLVADARVVLADLAPLSREIEAHDGAWYIRRIQPYRTQDDRIEGVVITFAEISEIKAAERKIQAAGAYSDSIIDTIRRPLVVLDEKLRVVSANRSFYQAFAIEPEAAVGKPFATAAQRRSSGPGLRGFLERVQAGPSAVEDYETEIEFPVLGRRFLLLNARNIQEGSLGERRILVTIDDITERKNAAEVLAIARRQAELANAAKSRFLAAASHDLRQPLQTISLLQGLLAKKTMDKTVVRLVARLDQTVSAMSGMLDTLLDINQLEAGIVRREIVDFPINTVLEQLRSQFAYHATAHGLGWRVVPTHLHVLSDPRLLEQMIRNLLSNAVKYTREGKILLGCRRRGDMLRIEVWDTGIGIASEQLSAVFDEFHQIDNPARVRSKGFGLGLSIVRRLADLLDHRVDVRSCPGKGSVFAVEVPLGSTDAPAAGPGRIDARPQLARRNGTILIVEDDPTVREMLGLLLDAEGHRTILAADGREALALAGQGAMRPDLILADYNLPNGPNGIEVISRLQKRSNKLIPAIILTGDIATGTLREIARHGWAHAAKPVKPAELARVIQELLGKPAVDRQAEPLQPTVFVVDDDAALRETLQELLVEHGRTVEAYDSAEAFLDAYRSGHDGCLVVDARLPGMTGIELLQRLASEGHRLPAIMITGHGEVAIAVQAMQAGATNFIEKPIGHKELLASIDRALEQSRGADEQSEWQEAAAARIAALTGRERQILDLVLAGHPSKNIAADLGISQRTVENHRAAIMKKTGSRSLSELIRVALSVAP